LVGEGLVEVCELEQPTAAATVARTRPAMTRMRRRADRSARDDVESRFVEATRPAPPQLAFTAEMVDRFQARNWNAFRLIGNGGLCLMWLWPILE
jgi:hypothetical protein